MADEVIKKLQALRLDDPTLRAMEKMAQATHPLAETLRAIEHSSIGQFERNMRELHERSGINQMMETARLLNENSGITRMMESINLHKDLARTALGPLWELRDAGVLDPPWLREIEKMRDTLGAFEARFRLPEMEETARLLKQYEESSPIGRNSSMKPPGSVLCSISRNPPATFCGRWKACARRGWICNRH